MVVNIPRARERHTTLLVTVLTPAGLLSLLLLSVGEGRGATTPHGDGASGLEVGLALRGGLGRGGVEFLFHDDEPSVSTPYPNPESSLII